MEERVGIGYDSHKFIRKHKLFLGGVCIPYKFGLLGHSDGDVLIHALIDALLGPAELPDIGTLFPDSDPKYKDIDSKLLLKEVVSLLNKHHFQIVNVDAVLLLEEPKIAPHYIAMKETLSNILLINPQQISIKAKTNEGMGFIGRKEGIASIVVAMLSKSNKFIHQIN